MKRELTETERDQFFSLSLDMLCISSGDGYFKWLNPAFTETLGWTVDELLTRSYVEFVHPDDLPSTIREVERQIAAGEKVFHFENRYRHKDGSWRTLSWKSAPRGELMYAVARDVTESNRLAEALRLSEERSRDFTEVASHFQWESDEEFRILHYSEGYARVPARERNEIIRRTLWQIVGVDPDKDRHWAEFRRQLMAHEPVRNFRYAITNKQGRTLYRALSGKAVFDRSGHFQGYRCATRDETPEVEARQQIVIAENKRDEFRTLLEATSEASPDGILVTDATGRYLFWNNRFREMWGLSPDYLQSRSSTPAVGGAKLTIFADQVADPGQFLIEIAGIYDQGKLSKSTFADISLKDGRVFVRHAARILAGKLPYAIVAWIYRDVTEQRKRDAALAQTQRLNTVGELSGGIAHELNNLLMIIGGNLELIEIMEPAPGIRVVKFAQAARLAVTRSAELITHLLAFSRRLPLAPKLTDVNVFIGETMKMLPRLLGESVTMKFVPGSELWQTIVDAGSLQTALISLATNARYAMPSGGSLVIETSNQMLDAAYAERFAEVTVGQYVMIAVTDSGAGMSPDIAKRAFEPFFTTKPVGKGTGLGLSVVYGFVKQSGGHVAIYSEEGRGTSVRIYLPRAAQESVVEAGSVGAPVLRGNKESILLVEDEAPVMAVARAFLDDLGYRVLKASNGTEALEIMRSDEVIDLLFTDVVLPNGMDGAEVARTAQKLRPGLKVLFASGYTKEALVHQGRLDAGVTLLPKPYRKNDLAQAIRGLL